MVREYETLRSIAAGEKIYKVPIYLDLRTQTEGGSPEGSRDTNHPPRMVPQEPDELPSDADVQDEVIQEQRLQLAPINDCEAYHARTRGTSNFQTRCLELINSPIFQMALSSTAEEFRKYLGCTADDEAVLALEYPEIFRSVCVCDSKLGGTPVRLKSKHFTLGPRGVQVGHCPLLNIANPDDQEHCALSVRSDSSGNARYVLEYSAPLFSHENGKIVYLLASQMDVSKIVYSLANTTLVKSLPPKSPSLARKRTSTELTSLAKRCDAPVGAYIDWPAMAASSFNSNKSTSLAPSNIAIDKGTFLDLNELVLDVKFFHRTCFAITPGPDDGFYEMSWLSAHLNAHREELDVGLAPNSTPALQDLGRLLAKGKPVSTFVTWGIKEKAVRMYCVPMLSGPDLSCWMCFLVDACIPTFWKHDR